MTPLHIACGLGLVEIVKELEESTWTNLTGLPTRLLDVNAVDAKGNTALHEGRGLCTLIVAVAAALNGFLEIMEFLIQCGADITIKNLAGRTVLDEAYRNRKPKEQMEHLGNLAKSINNNSARRQFVLEKVVQNQQEKMKQQKQEIDELKNTIEQLRMMIDQRPVCAPKMQLGGL